MSEKVINWVSHSPESTPIYPGRRSYRDPTADAAIGRIMAEERRKKRTQNSNRQYPPHRRTSVWKAKEGGQCVKVR